MRVPSCILRALRFALRHVRERDPDYVIGGVDNPYMRRWWVIPRNRYFNIYLHNVLRDDDDKALHDHPWPSLSIVLRGHIIETFSRVSWNDNRTEPHNRVLGEGDIVYRSARFSHRLSVPLARLHNNAAHSQVWTLFITGPRLREWGFWCPRGWTHWRDFETKDGCGEE